MDLWQLVHSVVNRIQFATHIAMHGTTTMTEAYFLQAYFGTIGNCVH